MSNSDSSVEELAQSRDPFVAWANESGPVNLYGQTCFCEESRGFWLSWVERGKEIYRNNPQCLARAVKLRSFQARGYDETAYPHFAETAEMMERAIDLTLSS